MSVTSISNARRLLNDPDSARWSDTILGYYDTDGLNRARQLAPWKFLSGDTILGSGSAPSTDDVSDACLGYYIAARALMEDADDPNNVPLAQGYFQLFEASL